MTKVTVIMPTYNRGELIARSIQTVQSQSFKDWELIVVDDASEDDTEEVVSSFDDPRIRYCNHEVNRGAAAARNTGIRESEGEYIAFLDSDDEWLPEKLELQLDVLTSTSDETAVVYCRSSRGECMKSGELYRDLLSGWCIPTTSAVMVEKKALDEVGGFDEHFTSHEDHDLWIRISKKFLFNNIESKLVIRNFDASEQLTRDFQSRLRDSGKFLDKWKRNIKDSLGKDEYREIKRKKISSVHKNAINYRTRDVFGHLKKLKSMNELRYKDIFKAVVVYVGGTGTWQGLREIGRNFGLS